MKKVLLDTSAYSHLLRGDERVLHELETADKVMMSVIVVAELLVGFEKGSKVAKNRDVLQKFLHQPSTVLQTVTMETAEIYQEVYRALQKKGTPIPMNDVWIAAQSLESGARLLTFDKHFSLIPGLRVWLR